MQEKAFQDYYSDEMSYCYGCGRLNEHGLQIKSYWDGDESICRFHPEDFHIAIPGYVYGGLIASLIDCHGTGTAAAAAARKQGRSLAEAMDLRYVTASLHVDYRKHTPLGVELEVRGQVKEITDRKVVVTAQVIAEGDVCAEGEVVAVKIPEQYL